MSDKKYAMPFELLHAVKLLSHKERINKFARALKRVIQPDMQVADIGTGTGILAMLAAKAGAAKVTAIDINETSIAYAREAAKLNGFADVIEFQVSHFLDFFPEERYDVVVCEMLSAMMLVEQQIPAASHINQHVLKDNGQLLPEKVDVFSILCECEEQWQRFEVDGLKFPKVPQSIDFTRRVELSEIERVARFDLKGLANPYNVDVQIDFSIIKSGIAHGICGMFESVLYDDIVLDMEDGWRELFIPFDEPLEVHKDNVIATRIRYTPGVADSSRLIVL